MQFNEREQEVRQDTFDQALCNKVGIESRAKMIRPNNRTKVCAYRGVSCNGNSWKVQFQVENRQNYLCSVMDARLAARMYDVCSIQRRGNLAKTNFNYYFLDLISILHIDKLG